MAEDQELRLVINGDADGVQKALDGFNTSMKNIGKGVENAGKSLTRGLTLPIVGVGIAATTMAVDFNSAMANVATLIPGNVERVQELKTSVQDMAIETGKSTGDLSDGLYQVISAFGDTADTVEQLEINAKAAAAGLATTTDAINLTSGVTKAYGDTSAAAVQQASDLALLTVRLGQTTFPELAASMGRVTPLAAQLNVTQQELFATMAAATGVTGGAAEVSTQLRGVLQSLMAPTADMADLMKDLGYANGQAMIDTLGLGGSIQVITKAAEESGKPLQSYISSIEGQTLALALGGSLAGDYVTKLEAMGNAAGATDAAFREQTEGINELGFMLKQATERLEVMAQRAGDGLAPALMDVLDIVEPLLDRLLELAEQFSEADEETQKQIISTLALVAALGPALQIIGKTVQTVSALRTAMQLLAGTSFAKAIASGFETVAIKAMYAGDAINAVGASSSLAGAGMVAAAGVAGYAIGNLAIEVLGLSDELERMGEKLGEWTYQQNAEQIASDALVDRWRELGFELDENNNLTELGIQQSAAWAEAQRYAAEATDGLTWATREYIDELNQLQDVQNKAESADIRLERARIRLREAQERLTEATKKYGEGSPEVEIATLDVRDATLGLTEAQNAALEAQTQLNTAISSIPKPNGNNVQQLLDYYQAIGDKAHYAATQALLLSGSINNQGNAKSATGGYNIPMYGGGTFADSAHLAVVGDKPEVIMPLGDVAAAQKYLPMYLDSLGIGVGGSSATVLNMPITGSRYDADFIAVTVRQVLRDELRGAAMPSMG